MLKDFSSRLLICLIPLVAAALVTGVAWNNYVEGADSGLRFNLGVDLAGGTILVYEVDPDWWNSLTGLDRDAFESTNLAAALKKRIDPNNLMEITIRPVGAKGERPRIEIILPMKSAKGTSQGQADIERVKSIIQQVGKLEFRLLADPRLLGDVAGDGDAIKEAESLSQDFNAAADAKKTPEAPFGYEWLELAPEEVKDMKFEGAAKGFQRAGNITYFHAPEAKRHFVLTKKPTPKDQENSSEVTGEDLASSRPDAASGYWQVHFSLKASGADRFWELTRPVGRYLAVILDNKVVSFPVLQARLRDNGVIRMGTSNPAETKRKVDELVLILRSGALPATLKGEPVSELTMGPGLGADTIEKGKNAVIISFFVVVGFMSIYYRFAGFVASVALFANLLLTVAFMVAVKATFTLPGLAGLVLMVGMAVDANVLIYERIREERERGGSLALAIRNGYDRAFPTIIDTHLTSIFTAIVLYIVGNDQLKGFGVSLTAGLIISLFTSLYMTRLMFDLWLARGWLRELRMMKMLARPNIDFMRIRNYWFTATVSLSILGLAIVILRGESGLNIDFTGGTAYSVVFKEPKPISEVRAAINQSGLPDPTVDAIFKKGEGDGDRTPNFTFRTTSKNRAEVREIVAKTFGQQLLWVDVKAGELKDVPPARPDDSTRKRVEFAFENKLVAPAEISRIVDAELAKAELGLPEYTVDGIGPGDHGLFERLALTFVPPEGKPPQGLVNHVVEQMHQPVSERLENFDSQLAGETQQKALAAIALSWLAISMYLWFRFGSWTFGLAAVLCLIHDLMFAIGLIGACHYLIGTGIDSIFLLEDFKLDLPAVAALLTLVGYSVNDTIVVFDRIREVRGKSPDLTPQMINDSINQTLSRTLLTGISTFLVVIVLYIWGGEGVHLFSFIMIVGVFIGTYSSIYVASPLLLILGEGKKHDRIRGRLRPQEVGV